MTITTHRPQNQSITLAWPTSFSKLITNCCGSAHRPGTVFIQVQSEAMIRKSHTASGRLFTAALFVTLALPCLCATPLAKQPNPPVWPSTVHVFHPNDTDIETIVNAAFATNGGHTPPNHGQFSSARYVHEVRHRSGDCGGVLVPLPPTDTLSCLLLALTMWTCRLDTTPMLPGLETPRTM